MKRRRPLSDLRSPARGIDCPQVSVLPSGEHEWRGTYWPKPWAEGGRLSANIRVRASTWFAARRELAKWFRTEPEAVKVERCDKTK